MFSKSQTIKEKESLVEQILCENYNKYYRLALSHVHNSVMAEDIVQEGAYKAIKNSHQLKNKDYAKTWVYRIMLNEIYTAQRKASFVSSTEIVPEQGYEDIYPDIDLQEAFSALTKDESTTVILRYFEDLKISDIAEVFNENVNTTKSRLYRALKKMKMQLDDSNELEGDLNDVPTK